MRRVLLLVAVCSAFLRAQPAAIQGIAVDSVTRQPLAGVHISLHAFSDDPVGMAGAQAYGAISRKDGGFSITAINAAVYVSIAQLNGYVYDPGKLPGDSLVTLKPGAQVTDFVIAMTPRAVVTGRVLDDNGDPVQHVQVTAQVAGTSAGNSNQVGFALSDDRGQYRFAVPPGKYYVQASPNRNIGMGAGNEIRADGLAPAVYGPVYYPDASSKERASPIDLSPGQHLDGVDLRLARTSSVSIKGVVTGLSESGNSSAFVMLLAAFPGQDRFHMSHETGVGPDGAFALGAVPPGHYKIVARAQNPKSGELQSSFADVTADGSDVTGITLALQKGQTLSGTIEVEGAGAKTGLPLKMSVRLEGYAEFIGQPLSAEVQGDGSFHIEPVFPGRFRLQVLPLPENGYLKSIRVGGTEVQDGIVDFSQNVPAVPVAIAVDRNGGRVEGAVLGDDGKPAVGPGILVGLVQKPEDFGNFGAAGEGSHFQYSGLRPGKYRLIAIDPRHFSGDAEAMKALVSAAPEFEIHEGDRLVKDIHLISAGKTAMEAPGATR